uniref:Uncharacterized protein n=1 Tax=Brassica oleracea var. oleracea TaxID=109376 RepID=A0A0D2ZY29_BRAOL
MRAAVSNYVDTQKLKFNDVRDRILAEEVRRIDSGEASTSSAFNVENRGRNPDRNNRSNGRSKSHRDAATSTTKASISYVDSPVDSWVLDSGGSFHTTPHRNIMENYVAGNYGKVYLADGLPLDIVGQFDDTRHNVKFGGGAWK